MRKYLHFEGLRGIAAVVVFLSHFKPTFCVDINKSFLDFIGVSDLQKRAFIENFLSLFYDGYLPVFIFWFMSAYLISIKLFDNSKNENNKYLVEATTKRYFRLAIPVFFSSLLCFILLKTHQFYNLELSKQIGGNHQNDWLCLWNDFNPGIFHFLRTTIIEVFIPGNSNYNLALWTMNAELLGSFLCFALFALIGKNKFRFIFYLVICIFFTIAGLREVSSYYFLTNYYFYLIFMLGFMWCDAKYSSDEGVYLKEKINKVFHSKITVLILLIIGFGVTIFSDTVYPLNKNIYYLFTFPVKAVAFTLLVNNFSSFKKLFSVKPLLFMGKISFSFYLLHIPLMFSLGIYLYLYAGISSEYKVLMIFIILSVITVMLSYIFMKLVDKKAISISDRIGKYFANNQ